MSFNLGHAAWEHADLIIDSFPSIADSSASVLSERRLPGYTEQLIRYRVEADAPGEEQEWTTAYLLIPDTERFPGTRPGMLALHQCGRDCDVGKEAVVGKAVDRQDQAYGLELVKLGFVVLAPDAINCASRCMACLREPGTHPREWTHGNCWPALSPRVFGEHYRAKRTLDCLRSVDVLAGHAAVDASRIGVIGHSMGSGMAVDAMLCDPRLQAAILSPGGCADSIRKRLAPRLLLQLQGTFDASPDELAAADSVQDEIAGIYEHLGAPDSVLYFKDDVGHHFSDAFKLAAYRCLQLHFGMMDEGQPFSIADLIQTALDRLENQREDLWWSFPNHSPGKHLPSAQLPIQDGVTVMGSSERVLDILELILVPVLQKVPAGNQLDIAIHCTETHGVVTFTPGSGSMATRVPHDYYIREATFLATSCRDATIEQADILQLKIPLVMS